MEDRISKAIEDIDNIRNMMEESKVHYRGLARLSVVYGIYCLIEGVMLFCSVYLSKYIYVILILRIGMLFLLIGSFIYIYRTESKCRNKYYLSLYGQPLELCFLSCWHAQILSVIYWELKVYLILKIHLMRRDCLSMLYFFVFFCWCVPMWQRKRY